LGAAWLLLRSAPPAVDPTWERIQASGVLPVCTDPSWPPFEFIDRRTGQATGFDIDLAHLLAGRLRPNVRAQIIPVGFDSLYDALLAGRCDLVLSAMPYEPMRTQDVVFTVAYFNAGTVLVAREEIDDIQEVGDLKGRVVGAEWGFVPEGDIVAALRPDEASRQPQLFQELSLRRYDTAEETLRALQTGELEAALVDRATALGFLKGCTGLQVIGEPITDLNFVIPMRPESFRLIEEVNRLLLTMRQDGTLRHLREKWF
jgi:ABC-type amino acid transport substrate-binding protein